MVIVQFRSRFSEQFMNETGKKSTCAEHKIGDKCTILISAAHRTKATLNKLLHRGTNGKPSAGKNSNK